MRVAIVVSILMIGVINTTDSRVVPFAKLYMKSINNEIKSVCNMNAYNKIKNIDLFNCFVVNSTKNCNHLPNFKEYYSLQYDCIEEHNSYNGAGIFFMIIVSFMLIPCCAK